MPLDDPTIPCDAVVWRRISLRAVKADNKRGGRSVTDSAFGNDRDGDPMSVVLADPNRDPQEVVDAVERQGLDPNEFGLVSFLAGHARDQGLGVIRAPLPDEPAHANVLGPKPGSVRRALRAVSRWVIRPSGWEDVALPRLPTTPTGADPPGG